MKKWVMTLTLTSLIIGHGPALRAEDAVSDTPTEETAIENEGTPVGQGSDEAAKAARNRQWQNIAIAAGAVAIAVTALVLVASNNGHK